MLDIENTGYGDYLNAERIVGKRGGVTRWHSVLNNIFIDCRKHAIEFPNVYNYSNGNIFSLVPPGYLKKTNPAPALILDLDAWRKLYDFEKDGAIAKISAQLDSETLEFTMNIAPVDLNLLSGKGPLENYSGNLKIVIDPRKKTGKK